ncbi:hypothetical protein [Seonamhaeicola sp.]|uniref:hypothetical protein n=1 Tax=Seonamhaeicola sp. TaxID=1912245 RepID=UPI00261D5C90|nr:hypothetical protein [Seonamhaeicola sp.]
MKLYKSDKLRFILGLVFIIIIYSCYYVFFVENRISASLSKRLVHFIKFAITVLVYIIGSIHLGKLKDQWLSTLWHFVHISGLLIITSIGLFDWFIADTSLKVKLFARSVQEMLISPILYVGMGLLNRSLNKASNKNNDSFSGK